MLRKRSASRSSGKSQPAASGSPMPVKDVRVVRGLLATHGVIQRFQACLTPSIFLLLLNLVYYIKPGQRACSDMYSAFTW